MSAEVWVPLLSAFAGAVFGGGISLLLQRGRFKHEQRLLRDQNKTEFVAEETVRRLLLHKRYTDRSLDAIRKRVGGYDSDLDGLRHILLRAGAVRVQEGKLETGLDEKWRLYERNDEYVERLKQRHISKAESEQKALTSAEIPED